MEKCQITDKVIDLIKKYEGYSGIAYKCPAGVWTIGYGSTIYNGEKVKEGQKTNPKEAEENLRRYCENEIKLPSGRFSENQIAALASLIYNIGQTEFDKSKCKSAIERKDWKNAKDNWDWCMAGGKVVAGLVKRRSEEIKLFFDELEVL